MGCFWGAGRSYGYKGVLVKSVGYAVVTLKTKRMRSLFCVKRTQWSSTGSFLIPPSSTEGCPERFLGAMTDSRECDKQRQPACQYRSSYLHQRRSNGLQMHKPGKGSRIKKELYRWPRHDHHRNRTTRQLTTFAEEYHPTIPTTRTQMVTVDWMEQVWVPIGLPS